MIFFLMHKKSKKLQNNTLKLLAPDTDRSMLLLQLGNDGGVVSLTGHEKSEHLLPVFGHDEL